MDSSSEQLRVVRQLRAMAFVLIPAYVIINWISMTQLVWESQSLLLGLVVVLFFTFIGPIAISGCIYALAPAGRTYPLVVVGAVAFGLLSSYANIRFFLLAIPRV